MESLSSPFLGSKISDNDVDKQIQKKCKNFKIIKNPRNSYIARLLSQGFIIARCKGRMEFGQRALGNRSILADPRDYNNIKKINDKIKKEIFGCLLLRYFIRTLNKILINPKKFILHI